jgi:hypothetical protein
MITVRPVLAWLFTVLTLGILAFGSVLLAVSWLSTEGVSDRGLSVLLIWFPTVVAVWIFGNALLLTVGRPLMLIPHLGVSLFALLFFLTLATLAVPSMVGPLALVALNLGAVYAARRFIFRQLEKGDRPINHQLRGGSAS